MTLNLLWTRGALACSWRMRRSPARHLRSCERILSDVGETGMSVAGRSLPYVKWVCTRFICRRQLERAHCGP